jgi:hypothetical protein
MKMAELHYAGEVFDLGPDFTLDEFRAQIQLSKTAFGGEQEGPSGYASFDLADGGHVIVSTNSAIPVLLKV